MCFVLRCMCPQQRAHATPGSLEMFEGSHQCDKRNVRAPQGRRSTRSEGGDPRALQGRPSTRSEGGHLRAPREAIQKVTYKSSGGLLLLQAGLLAPRRLKRGRSALSVLKRVVVKWWWIQIHERLQQPPRSNSSQLQKEATAVGLGFAQLVSPAVCWEKGAARIDSNAWRDARRVRAVIAKIRDNG